jgi:hypothetical protein
MDEELEHDFAVVEKYFEYIYVVLSHFKGVFFIEWRDE